MSLNVSDELGFADDFIASLVIIVLATLGATAFNNQTPKLFRTIEKDLKRPRFVLSTLIVLAITLWGLLPGRSWAVRVSIMTAVISALMAWFGHAGLVFAAFYVTLFLSYYFIYRGHPLNAGPSM